MGLLIDTTGKVFDTGEIRKGDLIWAMKKCWDEPKAGVVSSVTPSEIRVMHHPPIANVTQCMFIPAAEVVAGEWEIRWSGDLKTIKEYTPEGGD